MAIDPVCGMEVDEQDAEAKLTYAGRTFLFCSEACKEEFQENPEDFVDDLDDLDEEDGGG